MVLYHHHNHALPSGLRPRTPRYSYTTSQVDAAYGIPIIGAVPSRKIGIVSLGGGHSENDLAVFLRANNYPMANLDVLSVNGGKPMQYGRDPGSDTENMLDLERVAAMVSRCTGMGADMTIAYAQNNDPNGIADAWLALYEDGCVSIGTSWGLARVYWTSAAIDYIATRAYDLHKKNVTISVAAGDNSADDDSGELAVDLPAGLPWVWAVGGTSLYLNVDGSIQQERAWGDGNPAGEGGGGGFDPDFPPAEWQVPALKAAGSLAAQRSVPDASFNGDPNTACSFFASGEWGNIGGTSVGAPAYAGLFGAIKGYLAREAVARKLNAIPSFGHPGNILYPAAGKAFRDIVLGSNWYAATVGLDQCTGLGSPNGAGIFAAFDSLLQSSAPATSAQSPAAPVAKDKTGLSHPEMSVNMDSVFTRWHGRVGDALSHEVLDFLEADLRQSFGWGQRKAERKAQAIFGGKVLLSLAVATLQSIAKVFGPLAQAQGSAYIASLPLPADEKAFLTRILQELAEAPGTAGQTAPVAARKMHPGPQPSSVSEMFRTLDSIFAGKGM